MAQFSGTLQVVANQSFLIEGVSTTLMMMRNVPLAGTVQQKIAAATGYLVGVRKLQSGFPATVFGDKVPLGTPGQQVILVDR